MLCLAKTHLLQNNEFTLQSILMFDEISHIVLSWLMQLPPCRMVHDGVLVLMGF